jgi:hypothetical protein
LARRLPIDPTTNLPSINTFGELSDFLRGAVADEDSRQFSESMGQLAVHVEAIIEALRQSRVRSTVAPLLVDMLTVLRGHRNLVVNLGLAWRGLYEYAAYLQALNNFRVLIGQWLLDGGPHSAELLVSAEDFELVGWRTLGEGMLLIDMYDQWTAHQPEGESTLAQLDEPQVERAIQWWKKLRR